MMKNRVKKLIVTMLIVAIALSCTGCITTRIYGKYLDQAQAIDVGQGGAYMDIIMNDMINDDLDAINSLGYHAGEKDAATFEDFWQQWQELKAEYGVPVAYNLDESYEYGGDMAFVGSLKMENDGILMLQMLFSNKYELYMLYLYEDPEKQMAEVQMPVDVEEIEFILGEGTAHELAAKVTMPKGAMSNGDRLPAAVLVPGDGGNTMDMAAGNTFLYRDLAWGLAEQGIVTVRYDKRTYTYRDEAVDENADLSVFTVKWEYTEDANMAAQYLKDMECVDDDRIFYIGHSQGAQVGSRADQEAGGLYAGFILINSSPREWEHVIYDQYINYGLVDRSQEEVYYLVSKVKTERDFIADGSCAKMKKDELTENFILSRAAGFWVDYLSFDYVKAYQDAAKPMLILQGGNDYQITEAVDFAEWQKTMTGCDFVTLKSYENLNHLMVESKGIFFGHYKEYDIPGLADETVISDICSFMLEH